VAVEGAVCAYDPADPGTVGSFDVTSRGLTTTFGTGMPMLPMRWSLRPELAHRFGILSLRGGYQLGQIAMKDAGLSHGATARVQLALGHVKPYAAVGARRDTLDNSTTSDTWMVSAGTTVRF
jgi:hypothetical protein